MNSPPLATVLMLIPAALRARSSFARLVEDAAPGIQSDVHRASWRRCVTFICAG
jgi:hypothetical protein